MRVSTRFLQRFVAVAASLVLAGVSLTALVAPVQAAAPCTNVPGFSSNTNPVTVDSATPRNYRLQTPTVVNGNNPVPLIIDLHPTTGSGATLETPIWLAETGAARGYATVSPDGLAMGAGPLAGLKGWSFAGAGSPKDPVTNQSPLSDIAFMDAILDDITTRVCVDPTRIFVAGYSAGAGFAMRLACEWDKVAAVAPLAGVNIVNPGCSNRPVPLITAHGTSDITLPYVGIPGGWGGIDVGDVDAVVDTFATDKNRCDGSFETSLNGISHHHYTGCLADVDLYQVAGATHFSIPTDFDYVNTTLDFFDHHVRIASAPLPVPTACANTQIPITTSTPQSVDVGGVHRTYRLATPNPPVAASSPVPLIVELHGGSGGSVDAGLNFDDFFDVSDRATIRGYAAVMPDALPAGWVYDTLLKPQDDVGFMDAMIQAISSDVCVDPARIYVIGGSGGAAATTRMMCRWDKPAAVAPFSGVNMLNDPADCSKRPVPLLAGHAADDSIVPYDGHRTLPGDYFIDAVPTVVDTYATGKNGCLTSSDAPVSATVVLRTYSGCTANTQLFTSSVGGHGFVPTAFDFVGAALGFFDNHASPAPIAAPSEPMGATATPGQSEATVNWIASAQTGGSPITHYTVTASPGGQTCTLLTPNPIPPPLTCTIMGLPAAAYTFSVTATNAVGTSGASAPTAVVNVSGSQPIADAYPDDAWNPGLDGGLDGVDDMRLPQGLGGYPWLRAGDIFVIDHGSGWEPSNNNLRVQWCPSSATSPGAPGCSPAGISLANDTAFAGGQALSVDANGDLSTTLFRWGAWPTTLGEGNVFINQFASPPAAFCVVGTGCPALVRTTLLTQVHILADRDLAGPDEVAPDSDADFIGQNFYPGETVTVGDALPPLTAAITHVEQAGNIATLTATNTFAAGDIVTTTGLAAAALNGTWAISAATPTTFTFQAHNGATLDVADTGSARRIPSDLASDATTTVTADDEGQIYGTFTVHDPAARGLIARGTPNVGAYNGFAGSAIPAIVGGVATAEWDFDPPPSAPGAPESVTAVARNASADVTWTPPPSNGGATIDTYTVTANPGGQTCTWNAGPLTCMVNGLTNGQSYTFTVMATNANGTSPGTDSNSVTPGATPDAPAFIGVYPGEARVDADWLAPSGGAAIDSYTVTAMPGGQSCTVTAAPLHCTIEGLDNGTTYTLSLVATNAFGDSPSVTSTPVTPFTVPNAPAPLMATSGNHQVSLSWPTPANGGSALLDYTLTSSSGLAVTLPPGAASYVVPDLLNASSYSFALVARNIRGLSTPAMTSATPAGSPNAPTVVVGDVRNASSRVTWVAPPLATVVGAKVTGYDVQAFDGGTLAKQVSVGATALATTVTGLTNGTPYRFVVVAKNAAGSTPSAPSAAVTPATVPDLPTPTGTIAGDKSVTVTWLPPVWNGGSHIISYTVKSSPSGKTATVPFGSTSATVTGLVNGTAYTFTVVATNSRGSSLSPIPTAPVTPVGVPGAPTTVRGDIRDASSLVTWVAPSSTGGTPITGYTVHVFQAGVELPGLATSSSTLSALVTGLTNGTAYTYAVTATSVVGTSALSAVSPAVKPSRAPDAPAAPTVVRGNTVVTVSWLPPYDGGSPITGYTITASTATTAAVKVVNVAASAVTANINGLVNGIEYTFTVTAKNARGAAVSPASLPVTPAGKAAAPTAVTATPFDAAAVVTWVAPVATGGSPIVGFRILVTNPDGTTRTVDVPGLVTSFPVVGLTNGLNFRFAVAAVTEVGQGLVSTRTGVVKPLATLPAPPSP